MRISWENLWMGLARDVGQRSRCVRRQCGAVIVTPDNKPIAVGYNGPAAEWKPDVPPGRVHALAEELEYADTCDRFCPRVRTGGQTGNYDDCVTIHAEANALLWAAGRDVKGSTLYVYPGVPCFSCAKLIAGAGIKTVYCVTHAVDADRDTDVAADYLRASGVEMWVMSRFGT